MSFDDDPRAAYFKQMEMGLYVRMALLAMVLARLTPALFKSNRGEHDERKHPNDDLPDRLHPPSGPEPPQIPGRLRGPAPAPLSGLPLPAG